MRLYVLWYAILAALMTWGTIQVDPNKVAVGGNEVFGDPFEEAYVPEGDLVSAPLQRSDR